MGKKTEKERKKKKRKKKPEKMTSSGERTVDIARCEGDWGSVV